MATRFAALCLALPALAQSPSPLHPGELLQIISSNPDLCLTARVQDDGRLPLPGLDPVPVATLDLKSAAQRIARSFRDAATDPGELTLQPILQSSEPISISGAVSQPLDLFFRSGVSLSWLLAQAKPTGEADLEAVQIVRDDGFRRTVSSSDIITLHAGDRVLIPLSNGSADVVVAGGVTTPSTIRFRRGLTVDEAIAQAGGLAPQGDPAKVVLIRHQEPIPLSLPQDGAIQLRPREEIRVFLRQNRRFVVVRGDVLRPGLVDFIPGMTATQAIKEAGGPVKAGEYVVVRTIFPKSQVGPPLSLAFLQALRIPDPKLAPDEIVEVSPK